MMERRATPAFETHTVDNQPPEFAPRDLWSDDGVLREGCTREGAGSFAAALQAYGAQAGGDLYALGFDANRDKPRLKTHDRFGHRVDLVEFHSAYHQLLHAAKAGGVAGLSWHTPRPGAHVARAALSYLHHQAEAGTSCPLTMTHAAVPVLHREPGLREWADKAAAPHYDPRDVPIANKAGITLGMGMTEKQGGSDVRSNATRATPLAGEGEYALVGHKWFFSAPMSDGWLVLAQAPGGLSCFLMPRRLPDGEKNAFRLMRLKDKLGDWANASSEVEFTGAWARRIGEEGRGVATILQMVMLTRLDCMLGATAEMRMALAHAVHHARHRTSFGQPLAAHALMRNVLADLALESEAAMVLALRLARAVDARADAPARALVRVGTPAAKLWICKRAIHAVAECMEVWGGNGYVEEGPMPRIYRETPVNSIWEGSGNVMALDVLRALQREPEALPALEQEFALAAGRHRAFDEAVARWRALLADQAQAEFQARRVAGGLARLWQAALLIQHAPEPVAQAFVASRLHADGGIFGELAAGADTQAILSRAWPAVAC